VLKHVPIRHFNTPSISACITIMHGVAGFAGIDACKCAKVRKNE
jgi:hypothetical protein